MFDTPTTETAAVELPESAAAALEQLSAGITALLAVDLVGLGQSVLLELLRAFVG